MSHFPRHLGQGPPRRTGLKSFFHWRFAEVRIRSFYDHEVTKKLWAYIKRNNLHIGPDGPGRNIYPDALLKGIFPVKSLDMLKMAGYVTKHLS